MKKNRIIIIIVILIALVGSVYMNLKSTLSKKVEYEKNVGNAKKWYHEGLYDRAIDAYRDALDYSNSDELWDGYIEAYKAKYEEVYLENEDVIYDYINALEDAVHSKTEKLEMAMELSNLYIRDEDYKGAYSVLEYLKGTGEKSKKFIKQYKKVKYSYLLDVYSYTNISGYYNDKCAVLKDKWIILNEEGAAEELPERDYYSYTSKDGVYISTNKKESRLYDKDNKVLGIFDFEVLDSKMYSEDYVAVLNNGKYYYYDSFAKKKSKGYENAGIFSEGYAPVCLNGKWGLVDKSFKETRMEFDDIKIAKNGEYLNEDIIIASKKGKYSMYDGRLKEKKNKFVCDNMDVYTGNGLIAFEKDGKWGYVDKSGKIIIKPMYDEARSFSNGLAAVKVKDRWGFIDEDNDIVINCQFLDVDYFTSKGICFVKSINLDESNQEAWQLLKLQIELN